jgi:hypothetical protein
MVIWSVWCSTKPPIYNLIHEFLINMAFTMACPNFKKGLKMAFGPLGVNPEVPRAPFHRVQMTLNRV